ncbi:hypothetical protein EBT25_03475 [bacterium]|nr:hypothetical protein [bacterium]
MDKLNSREKDLRLTFVKDLEETLDILKGLMSQSFFIDCITSDQEGNFDSAIEFIAGIKDQVSPFVPQPVLSDFEFEDQQRNDEEAWEQKLEQPV